MVKKPIVLQKKKKKQPAAAERQPTRLGGALRFLGGTGGRMLGGMFGQGDVGASLGNNLGASISRWLGSGDYSVSKNSIVTESANGYIPMMHKDSQTIVVRHREFITEVTGKTAFTVQRSFPINPGLGLTFPWLSGIASQFSEYTVKGMVYHYIPSSGNAVSSTNNALGTVMLQTSYRANESAPTSKVELLNEYWSSEAKPSEGFCHPIECDPRENPFAIQYVRTGDVPSTDNVLLYDLGVTRLAVSGMQTDDIVLGDLWCTYEIELRKPKVTDLIGESEAAFLASGTASINTTTCFGTNVAETLDTTVGGASISSTALTLAPGNVGTYFMTVNYTGATAVALTSIAITGTGSSSISLRSSTASVAVNVIAYQQVFRITNPNTTTVLTPTFATLAGATASLITLVKCNPSVA